MLEIRALTKRFGRQVAVDGFDLDCGANEFLVIFGPAGAGKSTALKMVAGILAPSSGEVRLNGRSLVHTPPERRNMAMAFENYSLYSHLSVAENLAFPLHARKMGRAEVERRVKQMADILQIPHLLERRPGFLSGGQRQRVALGRALIRDADVYLLDEPISHLDAKLRHRMRGQLKAICAQKSSLVIHVTHDFREAMALSDRMVVLDRGKIMQVGPPYEVFHWPANEFVASFVGDPPMSFLDVTVEAEGGRTFLRITDGGAAIAVGDRLKAGLEAMRRPQTLRVGVRAGDLSLAAAPSERHHVPARAFVTETLGFRNTVVAEAGSNLVRAFCPPETIWRTGENLWLDIGEHNFHLFADGRALAHPTPRVGALPS
ncbi:MAG: ABC transporter ATP-binding protein [Roseiarcus sp.]